MPPPSVLDLDLGRSVEAADLRFRQLVHRFHCLGDLALAEPLAARWMVQTWIERRVADYVDRLRRLRPETLEFLGADRLSPAPIHTVFSK